MQKSQRQQLPLPIPSLSLSLSLHATTGLQLPKTKDQNRCTPKLKRKYQSQSQSQSRTQSQSQTLPRHNISAGCIRIASHRLRQRLRLLQLPLLPLHPPLCVCVCVDSALSLLEFRVLSTFLAEFLMHLPPRLRFRCLNNSNRISLNAADGNGNWNGKWQMANGKWQMGYAEVLIDLPE